MARLCEHLCDCDLVIWKTFKGATAGLVSPPRISMFAFVFAAAAAVSSRGGEGGEEGRRGRGVRGNNSQHARSVASPRRREKREREWKKKEKGGKKQVDCQS